MRLPLWSILLLLVAGCGGVAPSYDASPASDPTTYDAEELLGSTGPSFPPVLEPGRLGGLELTRDSVAPGETFFATFPESRRRTTSLTMSRWDGEQWGADGLWLSDAENGKSWQFVRDDSFLSVLVGGVPRRRSFQSLVPAEAESGTYLVCSLPVRMGTRPDCDLLTVTDGR